MCLPKTFGCLGFKDLESFNLDPLAKQGWHIFSNPNSSCAWVYKYKYFWASSFLDCFVR